MDYSFEAHSEIVYLISEIRKQHYPSWDVLKFQTSKTLLEDVNLLNNNDLIERLILKRAEDLWEEKKRSDDLLKEQKRSEDLLKEQKQIISRKSFLNCLVKKPPSMINRQDVLDFIIDANFAKNASFQELDEYLKDIHRLTPEFLVSRSRTEEATHRLLSKFRREMMPDGSNLLYHMPLLDDVLFDYVASKLFSSEDNPSPSERLKLFLDEEVVILNSLRGTCSDLRNDDNRILKEETEFQYLFILFLDGLLNHLKTARANTPELLVHSATKKRLAEIPLLRDP